MAFHWTRVAQNAETAVAMPRAVINVLPPGRLLVGFTRFSTRSSLVSLVPFARTEPIGGLRRNQPQSLRVLAHDREDTSHDSRLVAHGSKRATP